MGQSHAKLVHQDATNGFGPLVVRGQERRFGHFPSYRGARGEIVNGKSSHGDAKQTPQSHALGIALDAMSPAERVSEIRRALAQDERDDAPTESFHRLPQFTWSDPPEQVGQERQAHE